MGARFPHTARSHCPCGPCLAAHPRGEGACRVEPRLRVRRRHVRTALQPRLDVATVRSGGTADDDLPYWLVWSGLWTGRKDQSPCRLLVHVGVFARGTFDITRMTLCLGLEGSMRVVLRRKGTRDWGLWLSHVSAPGLTCCH